MSDMHVCMYLYSWGLVWSDSFALQILTSHGAGQGWGKRAHCTEYLDTLEPGRLPWQTSARKAGKSRYCRYLRQVIRTAGA
jgi:hypothetical protein